MLDDYEPLVTTLANRGPPLISNFPKIPNEVTDYYLQRVGFECEDVRLWVFPSPPPRGHAHIRPSWTVR